MRLFLIQSKTRRDKFTTKSYSTIGSRIGRIGYRKEILVFSKSLKPGSNTLNAQSVLSMISTGMIFPATESLSHRL